MELFTLVKQRRTAKDNVVAVIFGILTIVSLVAIVIAPVLMIIPIFFGVMTYFAIFRRKYEYETSYFDGDFKIVKIVNMSRRKLIVTFTMDDVLQIAPAGDRSVYKYENEGKVVNCYSLEPDAKPYLIATKLQDSYTAYKVDLDDRMLDEMCKKYRQKVIRAQLENK